MPTIFITGALGYIGGHTVNLITKIHPGWKLVILARTKEQASIAQKQWPAILAVVGDLEDHALVSRHATSADVVLNLASSEHTAAGEAIITSMGRGKKGLFIQMAGICTLQNNPSGYGSPSDIIYHDDADSLFASNFNENSVEHSITAAGVRHCVSTAIVCPALIYGVGNGPIRRRSTYVPYLIEAILKRGKGFTVNEGMNSMSTTHIDDAASVFVILINQALSRGSSSQVNPSAYYFLGAAEKSLDEVTCAIVRVARAHQAIHGEAIERLGPGQAAQIHPWAPMLWGTNCRGQAGRLRGLGWEPKGPCLFDALPEMVDHEIEFLAAQNEEHVRAWQTDVVCLGDEDLYIF